LGVSIISYAGEVMVGIATDAGLAPDPERIIAAFDDEFAYLQQWAAQSSAAQQVNPPAQPTGLCQASTRAGLPCKNRVVGNSKYCRVHQAA
jgi:hypothetical protein